MGGGIFQDGPNTGKVKKRQEKKVGENSLNKGMG